MAESIFWYDIGASVWRETTQFWVYGSGQWLEVAEAWVYDGAAWRRCWAGGASLGLVTVAVVFGDVVDVSWSYAAAAPGEWLMTFEVSSDNSSWTTVDTGGDFPSDSAQPFQIALDAFGLTTSDAYIRVSMRRSGIHAAGSPKTVDPPHF
jgi:hypothetical protein